MIGNGFSWVGNVQIRQENRTSRLPSIVPRVPDSSLSIFSPLPPAPLLFLYLTALQWALDRTNWGFLLAINLNQLLVQPTAAHHELHRPALEYRRPAFPVR